MEGAPLPPPAVLPAMPHAPDLTGAALENRYELHALIGEGTFGRVYRGRDRRLARPVAIKVIKPWWAEDPEWVRSFEREAQLLASISDPGIVQIFDVGSAPEGLYYVTELVDGESLVSRLRGGWLDPDEAAGIAEQMARALSGAHYQRVVHRDVKPANVLISSDGRVKVTDFGVARLAEGSTDGLGGTVVGTPRYMAPEQANGAAASPATDVYGVGVVLYEMLAGHPPFDGVTAVELLYRHTHEPPPPLPANVPAELCRVVARALAKAPTERFVDGAEMARALARARAAMGDRAFVGARRGRSAGSGAGAATALLDPPPEAPAPPPQEHADSPPTPPTPPGDRVPPTRVAPSYSPRHNVNPAGRRRRIALLGLVLLLAVGMGIAAVALAPGHARVPGVHGMTRSRASAVLRRAGLHAAFAHRYSKARKGTAIGQSPARGSRVQDGSDVTVTLSAGPAPVTVPSVVGRLSSDATAALTAAKLHPVVVEVPAPGVPTGQVTKEAPSAGAKLLPGTTVTLSAAEAPRWRGLTSFSGAAQANSVPFRTRGQRWRMVYDMGYGGTCALLFICSGPDATVTDVKTGQTIQHFGLDEGTNRVWTFTSGPGTYQIAITPGSDNARFTVQVEDRY